MTSNAFASTRAGPNGAVPNGTGPSGHRVTSRDGVDSAWFRAVLGHFATGVVAITGIDPATGSPTGLAANAFTSVSLDPPLIAFCVAHTSSTWPRLRTAGRLAVNVLTADQVGVCRQLAAKGADKFRDLSWGPSPGGAPLLDQALAWIECEIEAEHPAGDHVIVVCRVHHLGHRPAQAPLLFFRGGYGSFAE
jgi:3-hydroxy-9,10-secoandrosta-1,3,5(10)-triene-9,17-dione monooxygenase reductase component